MNSSDLLLSAAELSDLAEESSAKEKAFELSSKAEESPDKEALESPPGREPPSDLELHPLHDAYERRAKTTRIKKTITSVLLLGFKRSPS